MFSYLFQYYFAFKDVLAVALDRISDCADPEACQAVLKRLYGAINAVDISSITATSEIDRRFLRRPVSYASLGVDAKPRANTLVHETAAVWDEHTVIPLYMKKLYCSIEHVGSARMGIPPAILC